MSGNRFKWMKARRLIGMNRVSNWPDSLAVSEIAALAFENDRESRKAFECLIRDAIATGELAAAGEKRFEEVRQCIGEPSGWDLIRDTLSGPNYRIEPTVARSDFVAWEGRSDVPADSLLTGWWEGFEKQKPVPDDNAEDVGRSSQWHEFVWRTYLGVKKRIGKEPPAKLVVKEIQTNWKTFDTDKIIQEVADNQVLWRSRYGNESKYTLSSLDSLLSRLKKHPPL
jgi:hypothetical protein